MKSRKFLAVMLSLVLCLSMFSDGFIVFAQELADRAASEEAAEESAEALALTEETAEPAPAEFIEPEETTEEENQEQEEPAPEESEEAPAPEKETAKEADFPAQVVPAEVSPMDDPDIPESTDEEEKDYKFKVRVSSKNGSGITNGVTGTVFADYSGKVVIDDGTVSTSNVTGEVWMKNVASLGVPGERYFSRLIQTGMSPRDVSLSAVQMLFANLHTATIVGTVGDKSVSYAVVNGGSVIDATPSSEAAAREVWTGIFNADTISAVTAPTDDSYARLEAGSYIQVGASRLYFNELTIDNVTNIGSVAVAIRQAATLQNLTGKDVIENAAIVLMPNTVLSVGQSSVTLNKETRVTVDADGFDENELGADRPGSLDRTITALVHRS